MKIFLFICSSRIELRDENIKRNVTYPFMIALAKFSVFVNVPDNDPAKGFITDCQSIPPPPAIFSFVLYKFVINVGHSDNTKL